MTRPIDELLRQAGVPSLGSNNGTLSGGEMAIARIVSALRADWDRLDGQQQRAYYSAGSVHTGHRRSRSIRAESTQEALNRSSPA